MLVSTKIFAPRRLVLLSVLVACAAVLLNASPLAGTGNNTAAAAMVAPAGLDASANLPTVWPVKGSVTSGFGWRSSPFGDGSELHQGVDIASALGAPVVAGADGRVVHSGWLGDYGNMVQIDHGNGLSTVYGHNSQLLVSVGQTVKKGQVISYVGSTGKSTGPHLHYEVRENGTAVAPWRYLVRY